MKTRQQKGHAAHKRGHLSEYIALIHLLLKGYHILGFRLKTPMAEIDILATKGRRLAMVEVKQRRTLDEALQSVSEIQQSRLWQAGLRLQENKPQLASLELNIDLYVIAPNALPRHIKCAFQSLD